MANYVDGYVLPVKKDKIGAYQKIAKKAGKIWMDHGALQFVESVAEDMTAPWGLTFPSMVKPKKDEVVVFSFIVFKSRAHRDRVNKKVMADPRMNDFDEKNMPMDGSRMIYGGFKAIVEY